MNKFYDPELSYFWSNPQEVFLLLLCYKPRNNTLKINKAYRRFIRKNYSTSSTMNQNSKVTKDSKYTLSVSNDNISEKEEFKFDIESLKYIEGQRVTLHKHHFPKLEEIKMFNPSNVALEHDVEFELSEENYKENDIENMRTLLLDKNLTPRNFRTGSGINTIEFKTAINTFLSGGNERSDRRFAQLEISNRR